jgi:hypothetical protein
MKFWESICTGIIIFIYTYILSRAMNFGRQCHFKIWLDCHKLKNFPWLIIPTSTKCQKMRKKMRINVIQHDDRLWNLRPFYNRAFYIASKNDIDDQNLFLATVHNYYLSKISKICSLIKKIKTTPFWTIFMFAFYFNTQIHCAIKIKGISAELD